MNRITMGGTTKTERVCAWIAAFLLAVFLSVTILGTVAVQMITSAGLHLNVAADAGIIEKQYREICENIDVMAGEYGFSAENVKATVTREELKEMNRKSAEFWTGLLTKGEAGTIPRWNIGAIQDIIYTAAEEKTLTEDATTVIGDVREMIENTVFPLRETTITFGSKMAKDMADIRGIIRSVRQLPLLGALVCLACAGVIALLLAKEIFQSLKYYGTALAAGGIVTLAGCIGLLVLRSDGMLQEANAGLAGEFHALFGKLALGCGIVGTLLVIAGYLLLYFFSRKKNSETAESET